jgi:hypothetical protein
VVIDTTTALEVSSLFLFVRLVKVSCRKEVGVFVPNFVLGGLQYDEVVIALRGLHVGKNFSFGILMGGLHDQRAEQRGIWVPSHGKLAGLKLI